MESSLSFRARLVHAEAGKRVVQLSAWRGSQCLGSALGEAENAELAEERALERLQSRLNHQAPAPTSAPAPAEPPVRHAVVRRPPVSERVFTGAERIATPDRPCPAPEPPPETVQQSLSKPTPPPVVEPEEPLPDPEDWSDELAEIEVQLNRLGWDRTQEGTYLQRTFGHPSRNRITNYTDLASYVRGLRVLKVGSDSATADIPLRRSQLLQQNDELLQALNWGSKEGRELLEKEFRLSSRQQLSDTQLLEFNLKLENTALNRKHS